MCRLSEMVCLGDVLYVGDVDALPFVNAENVMVFEGLRVGEVTGSGRMSSSVGLGVMDSCGCE